MSPIGAVAPAALVQRVAGVEEVTGREVLDQVADAALDGQRQQDRPRDVLLRVLGLLAHRRDRLETDQDQDGDARLDEDEVQSVRRDDIPGVLAHCRVSTCCGWYGSGFSTAGL